MRVLTVVGLALVGSVGTLQAQHAHQVEFGGFGTYTRWDPVIAFNSHAGGGVRLGYFLNEYFGLEAALDMASPFNTAGNGTNMTQGTFNLAINSGGEHNILYVLGGYTRYRQGGYSPYIWLNSVHGAVGDRIFFGSHVALRLEGGVYYSLTAQPGSTKNPLNYQGSAGLSFFLGG